MKIKAVSKILPLVIAVTSFSFSAAYAAEEAGVQLIADKNIVARGEEFTYSVLLSNSGDLRGIQLGLNYDQESLEVLNCTFTDFADDAYAAEINTEDGTVKLTAAYEYPAARNGTVAQYSFRVKEDAPAGSLSFSVTGNGALIADADGCETAAETIIDEVSVSSDYHVSIAADTSTAAVSSGDEVKYTISMSALSDTRGISAVLGYDESLLTLVSVNTADFLSEEGYTDTVIKTDTIGEVDIAAVFSGPTDISGELAELTFELNAGIPSGEYSPLSLNGFEAVGADSSLMEADVDFSVQPIRVSRASVIGISCRAEKEEVKKGETITYTLMLDRIAMSRGFQTSLIYDPDVLTPELCTKGTVLEAAGFASAVNIDSPGIIGIACAYDSEKVETGVIAEISFVVNESAEDGFIFLSAGDTYAVDSEYNYVDAETVSNIDPVYIGRLAKAYNLSLAADQSEYTTGDIVYLTADLGEVSEFYGIQFTIDFDAEKLEYIAPERNSDYYGSVMRSAATKSINATHADEGRIEVLAGFGTKSPYSGNGDIFTAAFRVITNTSGNTVFDIIKVTQSTGDSCDTTASEIFIAGRTLTDVIEMINAIGTVTTDSEAAISAARAAYDALPAAEQAYVTNADVLTEAEARYSELLYELLPIYDYSCTVEGNDITVSIKNNKSDFDTPVLITAQYDETGGLVKVDFEEITVEKGGSAEFHYTGEDACAMVKQMLWHSISSMQPYQI